ncbi:MAG TPA: UvrD-helicase domain-containing protein [Terracidiphilus sp.]|jgi:ATP-dependent exoDNAse (exonuclease V) beta subunit
MSKTPANFAPPDQRQREQALDPTRSILVQAPAGSGKTDLLTRRFLRLLAHVDEPGQIVAITFTIAAAAEMRHRILSELEKAAAPDAAHPSSDLADADEFSMRSLARHALERSNAAGWKLLELPAQLRISTIDSFCRDLALQQPLLSGLGGGLAIAEQPNDLYRRAARRTINEIGHPGSPLDASVESLLVWRDNNWQELEDLLVEMLSKRDRWMQEFVLSHSPDWDALRARLERPFVNAIRDALAQISLLLDQVPNARQEALLLARFACAQPNGEKHRPLAELAEFPNAPFLTPDALEDAREALLCLSQLLLTNDGAFRQRVDKSHGFPADRKQEKARILDLIGNLNTVRDLESALASIRDLPPARFPEDDWLIVRACFTLLRHAAAQLKVVFAEAAAVDFVEVSQIAESVLKSDDGLPTDAALAVADGIRHLLVDEFQDTSRRQHQLLSGLIAAWPDHISRTCFLVGDPMQSIYFFRDADAELFARVKEIGLEIPNAEPLVFDFVPLTANFRTTPSLVNRLNQIFSQVFAPADGSGVTFSPADPARNPQASAIQNFKLHLNFIPQISVKNTPASSNLSADEDPQTEQVRQIVELIHNHQPAMEAARRAGKTYRIAVLARARKSLAPIAQALHEAAIPFRAVDLEKLAARPEVHDALVLARALLNPQDRIAWLGILRAPWCGLALADLHILTSADDAALLSRPIPELLAERLPLLSPPGRIAAQRVLSTLASAPALRASELTTSLGTSLQQIWLTLGGADCCDATAHANLDLLWSCLDRLPAGEPDLLGPALHAALDKLTALPDPNASSDCGVQLMTIHKSKGLEFEVVIVPDLQAKTAVNGRKLLSWLERGLKPESDADLDPQNESSAIGPDEIKSGEITEFLVAPLPSKGEDSGKCKAWVDRVYRERESQEVHRILYVAATRAREELHLFARPTYKVEANGDVSLVAPAAGLLSTAWPALEEEIHARFEEWKLTRQTTTDAQKPEPDTESSIESIAASGESNLFLVPSAVSPIQKPTLLRRLPPEYQPRQAESRPSPAMLPKPANPQLYTRHEGGLLSRALGTAVHALLEELARLRAIVDWPTARAALRAHEPRIAAQVRAAGIAPLQAAEIAAGALKLALNVTQDPIGQWILSPHAEAASEVRWSGVIGNAVRTVQADRIFQAGLVPGTEGQHSWWIIDYKTHGEDYKTHAKTPDFDPAIPLPQLREIFAPQLEAYAQVLRNLHGKDAVIRAGLYYPRMLLLDWWEL